MYSKFYYVIKYYIIMLNYKFIIYIYKVLIYWDFLIFLKNRF